MNCDAVVKSIPFYFYGEVAPDAEDAIEEHIEACAPCRVEWERQKALASALDRHALAPSPELLAECRHDLARAIYREESPEVRRSASDPWGLFREAFSSLWRPGIRFRQPVGAVALIALGFFAARFTGTWPAGASLAASLPMLWFRAFAPCSRITRAACRSRSMKRAAAWSPAGWTITTSSAS